MKVSVSLSRDGPEDWVSATRFAVEAERLGVDCLWSAEAWGQDGVSPLAYLAAKTSTDEAGLGDFAGGDANSGAVGNDGDDVGVHVGRTVLVGVGNERTTGDGGVARDSVQRVRSVGCGRRSRSCTR